MPSLRKKLSPLTCYFSALVMAQSTLTVFADMKTNTTPGIVWEELPPLPDKEGFAGGYAGVCGDALVVAGGANFPDKRPWEGGAKIWYDKVFMLEPGAKEWREAGRLPQVSGYGLSLPWKDGFLIIGGGDAKGNFKSVLHLTRPAGVGVKITSLPDLPKSLAMLAGAVAGNYVYVAGGLETPSSNEAANVLYRLDMNEPAAGWEILAPCPGGGRFLAEAGVIGETFYLFSGARPDGTQARRVWLTDAWSYHPVHGWKRLANLPRSVVAAPTQVIPVGGRQLLLVGGDDGSQWGVTSPNHKGFPRTIFAYDATADSWSTIGEAPFSLVTTSMTPWDGGFVIASGECEPGIRSPAVWKALIKKCACCPCAEK